MRRKTKRFCALMLTSVMVCSCFPIDSMAMNEFELPKLEAKKVEYSDDLQFISYAEPDELCQWDDTLGYFDKNQQKDLKAFIETNIAKGVTDDYEKAHLIFDWIFENVQYANDLSKMPWIDPWDVFTYKYAVCGGYSNLYKAMLNSVDIPSVLVSGDTIWGAHIWNAVYADGKWFYSDATWGGDYFDIGTEKFLLDHMPLKVQGLMLETEDGILLGYDRGLAVVGVTNGSKEVRTPDTYKDMYVTSIAIGLYHSQYGVKEIYVGPYVERIETQMTSNTLEGFDVDKANKVYASKDGVLFSKDMKSLLVYPSNKQDSTFVLPKETLSFNEKDTFANTFLKNVEVEEGHNKYSSYDGALYNEDQTELLMVPAGKTEIRILSDAAINDMAFANVDTNKITIYGKAGSPAHKYAQMYAIRFVNVSECTCEETEEVVTKATTTENGQIVVRCKNCKETKETRILDAVTEIKLSQTEYEYDGTNKMPEVTVKNKEGKLIEEKYYEVRYAQGCEEPGIYTVFVILKGDYYSGTLTASYEIKKPKNPFGDVKEQDYYYDAVLWAVANKITSGYSQEVFAPNATCTRAEVVTFLWREHGCPEPVTTKNPFTDVVKEAYYYKAILWAAEEGITKGVSELLFAPNDTVTRGQFVSLLHRTEGNQDYTVANPFADVKEGTYYYDAILWAYENGITAGYQKDAFAPDMGCTRGQVVSFLYRNR